MKKVTINIEVILSVNDINDDDEIKERLYERVMDFLENDELTYTIKDEEDEELD